MPCRCAERRAALQGAARSLAAGQTAEVRAQIGTVARTAVEDMAAAMKRLRPNRRKP